MRLGSERPKPIDAEMARVAETQVLCGVHPDESAALARFAADAGLRMVDTPPLLHDLNGFDFRRAHEDAENDEVQDGHRYEPW